MQSEQAFSNFSAEGHCPCFPRGLRLPALPPAERLGAAGARGGRGALSRHESDMQAATAGLSCLVGRAARRWSRGPCPTT